MTTPTSRMEATANAVAVHGLSERAAYNSLDEQPWDMIERIMANIWSPENPEGLVHLGVAENTLVQQELATRIQNNSKIIQNNHLGYGVGPRGSPRLRKALASFFDSEFRARQPVLEKEILILPGVMAVLEALIWSICNDGEGIIVPVPFYNGFKPAASTRARAVLVQALFQGVKGYQCLDDVFNPEVNKQALENAFAQAKEIGVKVRGVMLTNPHNPLGRCYPVETLQEIARFCSRNNLHLISDEVFAMSIYENPEAANATPFASLLELELGDCIDPNLVHVAYGMGKDFGAAGFHLGALHSRNKGLIAAVSSICAFEWVPYLNQDMWADILDNEQYLAEFTAKNRQVLAKHFTILKSFLDQHNIPYYTNVHAGVFVWVDLRRHLHGDPAQVATSYHPKIEASINDLYRGRESKLLKHCFASGVAISPGSSFSSEELGWFRITFAVEEQALHVGLQRLIQCLERIRSEGWESS